MNKTMAFTEFIKKRIKILFDRGAFHVFVGNFIMKFIGLFGSIFIVRLLSKSEYGTLSYVENLYNYGYIFAGLGLSACMLRYGVIIKDPAERKGVYLFTVKAQILFDTIFSIILILFAWFYPHPTQYMSASFLLTFLVVGLLFQDLQNTNLCYERSQLSNKRYMYFSIFSATLSVFSRILGSALYGVKGTIFFKVLGEILACTVIGYFVYKTYFLNKHSHKINIDKKKELLIFAINNMTANGIWILFMLTDVFLIGRLLNNPDVLADYRVAYVMPSNMAIISAAIATFITPYFVKNEKNNQWIKKNYIRVMGVNVLLIGGLAAIMFVFAPQLITLLYGESYLNIVPIMRILLIAHLINSGVKSITSSLLAAMGYAKNNMLISLFAFILQVILASIVLPKFGIMGLAINNVFVYLFMSILFVYTFSKKFNLLIHETNILDK